MRPPISRTTPATGAPVTTAEVSALASLLEELTARTTRVAESAQRSGEEALATGLFAVERDLKSALRRLTRTATSRA